MTGCKYIQFNATLPWKSFICCSRDCAYSVSLFRSPAIFNSDRLSVKLVLNVYELNEHKYSISKHVFSSDSMATQWREPYETFPNILKFLHHCYISVRDHLWILKRRDSKSVYLLHSCISATLAPTEGFPV